MKTRKNFFQLPQVQAATIPDACPVKKRDVCWPASGEIIQVPWMTASHKGQDAFDIKNSVGTPIYAPFEKTKYHYHYQPGSDKNHGGGCYAWANVDGHTLVFMHMGCNKGADPTCADDEPTCVSMNGKQTEELKKGEVIGKMSNTGSKTGSTMTPHLHFEIRLGNNVMGQKIPKPASASEVNFDNASFETLKLYSNFFTYYHYDDLKIGYGDTVEQDCK
jgi:hypothetical protein